MTANASQYVNWRNIDYKPALREISLDNLTPYLQSGQTALDIGCNDGMTASWLHSHGLNVLGIDINPDAVRQAREFSAGKAGIRFIGGDFLSCATLGTFELVLMVRVLTCFSDLSHWQALLSRCFDYVAPGGMIYIHDFQYVPENNSYSERYLEGERQGWRTGNFAVPAKDGGLLFVAHHHSAEELNQIMKPYERIFLNLHDSLSLNGNACRMFEFLGRKAAAVG